MECAGENQGWRDVNNHIERGVGGGKLGSVLTLTEVSDAHGAALLSL